MARRVVMTTLYLAGGAAILAIGVGTVAQLRAPMPRPEPVVAPIVSETAPSQASDPPPVQPSVPLTTTAPATASNGRLTIRLVGGQPER